VWLAVAVEAEYEVVVVAVVVEAAEAAAGASPRPVVEYESMMWIVGVCVIWRTGKSGNAAGERRTKNGEERRTTTSAVDCGGMWSG
jgi:hypothetical protein